MRRYPKCPGTSSLLVRTRKSNMYRGRMTDEGHERLAHFLAIEGVQPAIPQNPTPAEAARMSEVVPKGASASSLAAAASGNGEGVAVKPLVKHVLSLELQTYFEKICANVMDENNPRARDGALSNLRHGSG